MTPILALIQPFDIAAGARINVRAADAAQADAYGLGGQEWKAAVTERPVMSLELMSPDLDGKVLAGRSRISFNVAQLGLEGRNIKWDGAAATIYSAAALAWPAVTEFDGYVVEVSEDPDANLVTLTLQVSTDFLEGPLLVGEFTGGGGLLGEAAARGVLYPAGFGSCENIEPVWFDTTTWIGMIDGYANTLTIDRLMEGLDDRGPRVANYANYAALKNAIDTGAIPPGRWGTCVAQGLVGLGAPPVAPIGVNATFGGTRLGAIMQRILSVHRGVAGGNIDAAAFLAMDVAVDRAAHYWTKDQRDVRDLIEAMASNLNATPIVTFQKKVTITRGIAAAATAELVRSGRSTPRVIDSRPAGIQKPVYRLRARVARPANFLSFDQVLYEDTIEDKGLYDAGAVYRSGHLVWMPDKSSWLYTNATPGSGNAPPAWPITSNAYWENMTPPASASDLKYADGTPIENLKPAQAGANVTQTNTAAGILGQGALATQNAADWRTQVMARPAIEALYYDFNYADTAASVAAGWVYTPNSSHITVAVTPNTPNGKSLIMGTGTGGTAASVQAFAPEWVPYNSNDLYEVAFDLEVISGDGAAVFYAGVAGEDRNGNNLGGSFNYVAANGVAQAPLAGQRFIRKGYFTGFTTSNASGLSMDPLSPAGLPDGSAAGFGAGGVVRFRPMVLVNYNTAKGQMKVHAIRVTRIPARLATQDEVAFGTALIKETSGGSLATLANFKTLLGTAAGITGQGFLATQNFADWKTRITGAGKPANNAGMAKILVGIGVGIVVTGNSSFKGSPGVHGVYDGGVVGVAQKDACFISSSCTYDGSNAGGWRTTLCLDRTNSNGVTGGATVGNFIAEYTAGVGSASLNIMRHNGSAYVTISGFSVPGYTFSTRRMALISNGKRAFVMIDGVTYGGNSSSYDVVPGATYWPKVLNYHQDALNTAGSSEGIVDIQYGEWTDVRTFLDDGTTVLAQAGFKTDEGTASGIIGQGPGATAGADDVLNYRNINATSILAYVGGGQYSYDNVAGGQLRITLPNGYSNTMIMFTVDIYEYSANNKQTYIVAGYTNTTSGWINCSAQYIGPEGASKTVRFADDGAKCVVAIGDNGGGGSTWNYPKVVIRDVMVGHSNQSVAAWKAGWGIFIGSVGAITIYATVTKPRPGDAVFGEGIFESAAGATASLANFKTLLGTAASIVGQGALATLNQVDMSTTQVLPRGSAPPTLANNGFTYTSNTNSITVSWPTMTVYRSDASTISIASGSQAITGLSAGTTYRIYPFIADTGGGSATMDFVTGVSPAFGSPGILYSNSSPNVAAASQMYYYNRIPMGNFALATTSSGGGGGGGGGGWNCLHEDMLLCQRPAGETEEGTAVATPEHMGCSLAIISRVERHYCSRWIEIYAGEEMIAKVTERHLFYRATDMSPVAARDVRLGDLLRAEGDHVEVTGLRLCTRPATAIGIDIGEPHLHYAGPRRLICHNGTAKP